MAEKPSYQELEQMIKKLEEESVKRKQAEESLKESEEKFRQMFETMNHGVAIYEAVDDGQDFIFTDFNAAGEQIEGVKREAVIGKRVTTVFPGVEKLGLLNVFKRVWQTGKAENHPVSFYKDNRLTGWRKNFIGKLPSGKVIAIYEDLTEHKQAETALRESEEKYRSMMEAMTEPTYICTSDCRLSYMNPAMIKRTGYDATGEFCYKAINALDEQCPWCVLEKILQGESVETEIESPKDGRSFRISHAPIFHQDGSISKITICRDITDQKLIRNALMESERELKIKAKDLEELNAALKVLLKKRQEDKEELEEGVLSNVRTLIEPYIVKLKKSKLPQSQKTLLNILESNLNEIVSPFSKRLSSKYLNFTPTQIQVANLVKQGKTNKDIAEILNVSGRTIAFHRENIRKKFDLTNKKTNLKTYLISIN